MSDYITTLIPEDPNFVPDEQAANRGKTIALETYPSADEVGVEFHDDLIFVDCGTNFESASCPSCNSDIGHNTWIEQMDSAYQSPGFNLEPINWGCCETKSSLHDLVYSWPQGFARFCIYITNPGGAPLTTTQKVKIEEQLGCNIREILRHY